MTRTFGRLFFGILLVAGCAVQPDTQVVQSALTCTGDVDCNDNNVCTDDACDLGMHLCKHFNNSNTCADSNTCTVADSCNSGACVGGNVDTSMPACTACTAVVPIPAAGGAFNGTIQGTSLLKGSCIDSDGSPERIFAWTPSTSGTAVVQTCGGITNYDTALYAMTSIGAGCTVAGQIACNDDTPGCAAADGLPNSQQHGSRINLTVTAGTTYYLVVDGWGGRKGNFTLTVTPPTVCGNNLREGVEVCDGTDRTACSSGVCKPDCTCQVSTVTAPDLVGAISSVSVQRNASVPAGDFAEGCSSGTSGLSLLRFSATTTNIGTADLHLGNPMCPDCTVMANQNQLCGNQLFTCSGAGGHNHAHYRNYAKYELLDGTGTVLRTGHKQGFCLRDSTCTGGAALKYTCVDQGVSVGCGDVYDASLGCQYIDITGVPDGAYTLRVIVDPFNQISEVDETNNIVTMPITLGGMAPPPEVVPALGGTFTGTTGGASFFSGGPTCEGGPTSATPEHVFAWTPTATGSATISSCSPNTRFDTVLYVSTNADASAPLACQDDTPGCAVADGSTNASHHGSSVTMNVTAGTTYYIVLDSYGGSSGATSGQYALTIVPPAGSTATGAGGTGGTGTPDGGAGTTGAAGTGAAGTGAAGTGAAGTGGTSGPIVVTGTTMGASQYAGSCAQINSNSAPDFVYTYMATRTGVATFQTCSPMTKFDTVLYVRTALSGGAELACADDTIGCATGDSSPYNDRHGSSFTLNVTAGTTYYVVVDGFSGSTGGSQGNFVLTITPP